MSFRSSIKSGIFWSNLSSISTIILRFGVGIYLARKIDPNVFGQQGLILATLIIFTSVVTLGENFSIIGEREKINKHLEMQVALRLIMIGIITLAISISYIFDLLPFDKNLLPYFIVLYIITIPGLITAIYHTYLSKLLKFRTLSFINIFAVIASIITAILLTNYGFYLWALVWLEGTQRIVTAVLTFVFVPKRFKPKMDREQFRKFFHFGKFIFLSSIIERFGGQLDKLITGNLIGHAALGFYNRSFGIGGLFQQMVIHPLLSVFDPAVGAIRNDRQKTEVFFSW